MHISGMKVLNVATNGFEQSERELPRDRLKEHGATVHIASPEWEDSAVVNDRGVITSRNPGDLEAFSLKIMEEIAEGKHMQRSAA